MTQAPPPIRVHAEGLVVAVRVTPKSSRDAIEGAETRDDGSVRLKLRVRAAPSDGRANAAVVALLAAALGLPKSALAVIAGDKDRDKSVLVRGAAQTTLTKLTALMEKRA